MGYTKQYNFRQFIRQMFSVRQIKAQKFTCEAPDEAEIRDADIPVILKKQTGRDFVILNLTDLHYSDYDIRFFMSLCTERTIKRLVREVKPDLITVTGDTVCGKSGYFSLMRFIDMMEAFETPWAPVFGNHDDETNCDLFYQAREMIKAPHCLMKPGNPEYGCGNYALTVKNETDTVEAVIMTDSKHGQMSESLREWVVETGKKIGAKETAVMMHIPLPEYQTAYDEAWNKSEKCWNEGYCAFGEQHEKIACQRDENGNPCYRGTLEKLKEIPSLKHILCGHEHLNNWSAVHNGVRLTYTLKVGAASGHRRQFNGGTVITVGDNGIKSVVHRTRRAKGFKNLYT